jgi:hypothetical protein
LEMQKLIAFILRRWHHLRNSSKGSPRKRLKWGRLAKLQNVRIKYSTQSYFCLPAVNNQKALVIAARNEKLLGEQIWQKMYTGVYPQNTLLGRNKKSSISGMICCDFLHSK